MSSAQRRSSDPEPAGGAPAWIMTYSDVITLLMTFFVLLLTFATDQEERFERMRISLFGGSRGTGIVSPALQPVDQDSLLWRERPRTARMSQRGSLVPPSYGDPALIAMAEGLRSLDGPDRHPLSKSHRLSLPRSLLLDQDGRVTPFGARLLHRLAKQLRNLPHQLDLQVNQPRYLTDAVTLAQCLVENESIQPGRIGVGVQPQPGSERTVTFILNRQL